MIEKQISTTIQLFDSVSELPEQIQKLMNKAVEARHTAYAPYSKFKVGAALILENGEVVMGSNQENASYPSGLCAERTAIYAAGANYPNQKIKTIAITATSEKQEVLEPIAPCGACRQAIAEYEQKQKEPIEIFFTGSRGKVMHVKSLLDILPLAFDNKFL
ncbi:cytidine deaminase [Psychroflexus sp. CAK57W]|uniref:cytidine deaminase n=1 Tax=Psychroflexus curvus TaxID=2873595 RepID=UPI001CCC232E|nr:cytidine deaminase [Psychroflexus curvus]MBZ9629051.1 cytidine deaminase [Psychroflexus curvus]MBZ9788440.1 cytidine deaminase [Psychroflexus curvus]